MFYKRKLNPFDVIMLLIIMVICFILVYHSFHNDIYPLLASEGYKEAGLRFFYSIFDSSIELKITVIFLLIPSNLFVFNLLQEKNNHFSYMLKTRLGTKKYLIGNYIQIFIKMTLIYMFMHFLILLFIHLFLIPIEFVDNLDEIIMQRNLYIFSNKSFISLIIYMFLSSLGYASFGCLILSIKNLFKQNYSYRIASLLVGIIMIALPAIIGFKLYSIVPNENILNFFNTLFLPSLVTPGLQAISGFELSIHPIFIYLCSFFIYNLSSVYVYYYMSRMEYKYE